MNNKYQEFIELEERDYSLKYGLAKGLLKIAQENPSLIKPLFRKVCNPFTSRFIK